MNYTNIFRVESSEKNLFGKMSTIYTAYDRDGKKVPAKFIPKPIRQEAFDTKQCIAVTTHLKPSQYLTNRDLLEDKGLRNHNNVPDCGIVPHQTNRQDTHNQ